jgi:hypothetical protein
MSKTIQGFFTNKGSVSVKVRNALKVEVVANMKQNLIVSYPNVILGKDGSFYIEVGNSKNIPIYARLELTISTKSPND